MRLRTCTLACAVAATATVPLAGVAVAADRDCADFTSQAQAQAALRPGDPDRLDADHDGIACENHDYGSGATGTSPARGEPDQVGTKPIGGVAAGGGPAPESPEPLPLAVGALVAAGIGGFSARRFGRRLR